MGAAEFDVTGVGKTAEEVFRRLGDDDRYENGHSYSGGIGMKGTFVLFALPTIPGVTLDDVIEMATWIDSPETKLPSPGADYVRRVARVANDKFGPAAGFDVTETEQGKEALARWLALQQRTGLFDAKGVRQGPAPTTKGLKAFRFFGLASS